MLATVALLLALGLDILAVALGLGIKGVPRTQWMRLGVTFALFAGLMPAIGLLIGRSVSDALGDAMNHIAGAMLLALGAWEIRETISVDHSEGARAG
jgi:putative Mn2+ efflux pump MntP